MLKTRWPQTNLYNTNTNTNIYPGKSSEVFLGMRLIHLTFGSSLDCDVDVKAVSGKNSILWLLFQLVGSPGRAVVRWADCANCNTVHCTNTDTNANTNTNRYDINSTQITCSISWVTWTRGS